MQKILHEEEEKNDFDHQTFLLERKKDRKISLFLLSSLLLLLLLLRVEIEVVKVARVVGRSAAVDFDDVWWSFSVVVVASKTREIFFFSFFLCVWVGVSLLIRNNSRNTTPHETPSPLLQTRRPIKVVFSSSSCACVHFRVSNYACLFFFFQRERVFALSVHCRKKKGGKKKDEKTPQYLLPTL